MPLIEFRSVTLMRGATKALDNFTLTIEEGEHVAILGPNGSGKSSFIKAITRECYPVHGSTLRILGRERWNIFELRALLGIVTNDWMLACSRDYTGLETVLSGFFSSVGVWPHHLVTPEMERKAAELLHLLEVPHLARRNVSEMSSGEARRMLIGRALVHDPATLVFDEPGNSLDPHAAFELRSIMRRLAQMGKSIILVTHSLPDIIPEIDRIVMMKDGQVFLDGPKEQLLTPANLSSLFRLPVEMIRRGNSYHIV